MGTSPVRHLVVKPDVTPSEWARRAAAPAHRRPRRRSRSPRPATQQAGEGGLDREGPGGSRGGLAAVVIHAQDLGVAAQHRRWSQLMRSGQAKPYWRMSGEQPALARSHTERQGGSGLW